MCIAVLVLERCVLVKVKRMRSKNLILAYKYKILCGSLAFEYVNVLFVLGQDPDMKSTHQELNTTRFTAEKRIRSGNDPQVTNELKY